MGNKQAKILKKILEKTEKSPSFGEDFVKYVKLLSLQHCPEGKKIELENLMKRNEIDPFLTFVSKSTPNFEEKITNYISNY